METLSNIQCFVRSAEAGSFAEAARRLGLTPAGVGKNVARLESNLGVRLFQRSTRRLTLTEAGERFLQEVGGSLEGIQTALANVSSVGNQPSGTLKVSMGLAFGRDYILPLLGEFLERYPDIVPDWHFDNRQVDLIGEGFDAAIGGGFELPPGVVARNLTPGHLILLASPAYLRDKPPIRHPGDLGGFDGIRIRSPQTGRVRSWPLRRRNGEEAPIELRERMTMSDPEATCEVAAMGLGITLVCMQHAYAYLESGALVRVLPDWYVDAGNTSLYYAANKLLPAKTGSSSTSSSTTSAARTWPGASPPSQPASASHPSLRQPGKALAPASPEKRQFDITDWDSSFRKRRRRAWKVSSARSRDPPGSPAPIRHMECSMRESLGVSLPSRPLLLKLGLLSYPGRCVPGCMPSASASGWPWRSVGSPAWPCSSSSCATLGKR